MLRRPIQTENVTFMISPKPSHDFDKRPHHDQQLRQHWQKKRQCQKTRSVNVSVNVNVHLFSSTFTPYMDREEKKKQ